MAVSPVSNYYNFTFPRSPMISLGISLAFTTLAILGVRYLQRPRQIKCISYEKNIFPSDILPFPSNEKSKKNIYSIAEELIKFIQKNSPNKELLRLKIEELDLSPKEELSLLALAKAQLPEALNPAFYILSVLQQELIQKLKRSYPRPSLALSPLEISLREGELPKIDPILRDKIRLYLAGSLRAKEIGITKETYREVLLAIKIIDLEDDRKTHKKEQAFSTYELRSLCLKASEGELHSFEAYTKSFKSGYFENPFSPQSRSYAAKSENYIPERIRFHANILQKYVIDAFSLSRRFNDDTPTMYVLRGNTAVGKTYAIKNDPRLSKAIDEQGIVKGALCTDTVKSMLRHRVDGVTNNQIHIEGAELEDFITQELRTHVLGLSMIVDQRNAFGFVKVLVSDAEKTGKKFVLKDIDAPLMVSALRVLKRDPKCDPCVPFGPIADGLKGLRKDRFQIIDLVLNSKSIKQYELYVTDTKGKSGIAARKTVSRLSDQARLEIIDQTLYDYATSEEGAEAEIRKVRGTIIVTELCNSYADRLSNLFKVHPFKGQTVEAALYRHSRTLPEWD